MAKYVLSTSGLLTKKSKRKGNRAYRLESEDSIMRVVRGNQEIPHLWAHQFQSVARNSKGSFYFNGNVIYSYRDSFPIARRIELKGRVIVLFTTRTYSVTTTRHCSMVRSAIPSQFDVFDVPNVFADRDGKHKDNLADYQERINRAILKAARARSSRIKVYNHDEAVALTAQATLYASVFKFKFKPVTVPALDSAEIAKLREIEDRKNREARARQAAIDKERREEYITEFRAGRQVYGNGYEVPTMLRLVEDGRIVETSMGARVLAVDAKRALTLVKAVRSTGREWVRNGKTCKLGPYQVDKVTADGTLYAGCHIIEWAEIERFTPELEAHGNS